MKKIFKGFSLMEMMVVMLIVAVVMAATAPMISKKMIAAQSSSTGSPWRWKDNIHIFFNQNADDANVMIGTNTPDNTNKPLLLIKAKENKPQIQLEHGSNKLQVRYYSYNGANRLTLSNNSGFNYLHATHGEGSEVGDSIVVTGLGGVGAHARTKAGANATAGTSAVAVGYGANALQEYSTAIGTSANACERSSTAIGYSANTNAKMSAIALGYKVEAKGANAISIGSYGKKYYNGNYNDSGRQTIAEKDNTIALGAGAQAKAKNAIAIGSQALGSSSSPGQPAPWYVTTAEGQNSIAIGMGATATAANSVAIGPNASATQNGEIVIGNNNSVVHIKGHLVVDKNAFLNVKDTTSATMIRAGYVKAGGYYKAPYKLLLLNRDENSGSVTYTKNYEANGCALTDGEVKIKRDGNPDYDVSVYTASDGNATVPHVFHISDRRLKNVGDVYKGGLAELKKLDFYNYTFKKDESKTPRVGVMAQDLQKVFPDAVIKGDDGFLRIRLEDMFYAVINAVKELDARLTALAEEVKSNIDVVSKLQDKVTSQEKQIAELKKQNAEFEKQNTEFEKRIAKLEKIGK